MIPTSQKTRATILVVDDDEDIVQTIKGNLETTCQHGAFLKAYDSVRPFHEKTQDRLPINIFALYPCSPPVAVCFY